MTTMDEPIVDGAADTGAATDVTSVVDTGVVDPAAAAGDGTQVVDPAAAEPDAFDALFGDLKADEPVVADPNAAAAVVPEQFQKALQISEFVKEPAQLEGAIRVADEYFQIQQGKAPAYSMLEGLRASNPQRFEKVVTDELIPYIEHITGKKLGGEGAAQPDPVKDLQAEVERLKQAPILERQEREQREIRERADTSTRTKVEELIKAGTGIFDGGADDAINAMAAHAKRLGIDVNTVMKDVLAGKTESLEKLYRATEKLEMLRVKGMVDRLKARNKALKGAVPPGKGGGGAAAPVADGKHDLTTQAGRTAFMNEEWKAGRGAN
jgi:hypothetical protein